MCMHTVAPLGQHGAAPCRRLEAYVDTCIPADLCVKAPCPSACDWAVSFACRIQLSVSSAKRYHAVCSRLSAGTIKRRRERSSTLDCDQRLSKFKRMCTVKARVQNNASSELALS